MDPTFPIGNIEGSQMRFILYKVYKAFQELDMVSHNGEISILFQNVMCLMKWCSNCIRHSTDGWLAVRVYHYHIENLVQER